jgi:hypothetical protein
MSELKTTINEGSGDAFLNTIEDQQKEKIVLW